MEVSEPSTSTTDTSLNRSNDRCDQTVDNSSDVNPSKSVDEFLSTGRTGRRNALPDILEEKSSQLNTSELPNELQKLSFNDSTQPNGGSSGESSGTASCVKPNE